MPAPQFLCERMALESFGGYEPAAARSLAKVGSSSHRGRGCSYLIFASSDALDVEKSNARRSLPPGWLAWT